MATNKISETADELADDVTEGGRRAGAGARRAGARIADEIDDSSARGARAVRSVGRRGSSSYDQAVDDLEDRAESFEETIRRNPLAATGAALLAGIILGRFVL